jgi:hypothetical protein
VLAAQEHGRTKEMSPATTLPCEGAQVLGPVRGVWGVGPQQKMAVRRRRARLQHAHAKAFRSLDLPRGVWGAGPPGTWSYEGEGPGYNTPMRRRSGPWTCHGGSGGLAPQEHGRTKEKGPATTRPCEGVQVCGPAPGGLGGWPPRKEGTAKRFERSELGGMGIICRARKA